MGGFGVHIKMGEEESYIWAAVDITVCVAITCDNDVVAYYSRNCPYPAPRKHHTSVCAPVLAGLRALCCSRSHTSRTGQ